MKKVREEVEILSGIF